MKLVVLFALIAATSAFDDPFTVTGVEADDIQPLIDSIYHPSTDPTTATALEQLLLELLGIEKPVVVEDDESLPIDESIIVEPVHTGEFTPIDKGPTIVEESIILEPADIHPPIINVHTNAPDNIVVVEEPEDSMKKFKVEDVVIVDKPEITEDSIDNP